MGLSRLRSGEWLAGIGGAVLVLSLFLPWYVVEGCLTPDCENRSAFDVFSGFEWFLLVVGALGILALVLTAIERVPAIPLTYEALATPVAGVAAALVVWRLADPPFGYAVDRGIGVWLGLAGVLCLVWGLWRAMRQETGAYSAPPVERLPAPPR